MKCKQCGKVVRSISHWAREHKKWLASRPRKKRAPKSSKKSHTKARRTRSGRKRGRSASETVSDVPEGPVGFVVETVTYRRA